MEGGDKHGHRHSSIFLHTWLNGSGAAVAWFCCQVVLHAAVALLAAEVQASGSKRVYNEDELAQEGLQKP